MDNLFEIENISKSFAYSTSAFSEMKEEFYALKDVSLSIKHGETLALAGESGSGKSTLANCILQLIKPTSGKILFKGKNILEFSKEEMKHYRAQAQLVFQNPYSSLNPKMRVYDILAEPLIIFGEKSKSVIEEKILDVIESVSLSKSDLEKYPFEFSGGQRQRIAIARALILKPEFLILDEPTSALDVSIQAQIINLLLEFKESFNMTYLFISHDLNLIRHISDRVAILKNGELVELGTKEEVFGNPKTEYTKKLLLNVLNIT